MKYEEAIEASLKVRWKTSTCSQGESCWCRVIVPETPIKYEGDKELYISSSGNLPKEYAEHFVKIHNGLLEE